MLRALVVFAATLLALSAQAEPVLVTLADGTYRAVTPADWDGKRALPLVLYLHGYREDSAKIVANSDLVDAVTALGAILVVPDGLNMSWSFANAPSSKRDDIAFLHEVVADAERRWPIDQARVFAAGFSIGGSMVWDLACRGAQGFAAFLPFSGDFWVPYPSHCDTGPVNLRHTHAVNDHTFPMTGRPLFGVFQQGDVHKSFAIIETTDACTVDPDRQAQEGELDCESWTKCGSGKQLQMCLHHGDHQIQGDWLHRSVEWALQRVAAKS